MGHCELRPIVKKKIYKEQPQSNLAPGYYTTGSCYECQVSQFIGKKLQLTCIQWAYLNLFNAIRDVFYSLRKAKKSFQSILRLSSASQAWGSLLLPGERCVVKTVNYIPHEEGR